MPRTAFVPGQIASVEGRSFRSLYPRQTRGLVAAAVPAVLSAWLLPLEGPLRFLALFLAALPGLVYGFFQPGGRPVEHWLQVMLAYHLSPRVARYVQREVRPRA